jgi:hypothetical protein
MKNVTLAVDEKLLEEGRRYARQHRTSLNGLLRDLLRRTVSETGETWTDECIGKMDRAGGRSGGKTWKCGDLYDV